MTEPSKPKRKHGKHDHATRFPRREYERELMRLQGMKGEILVAGRVGTGRGPAFYDDVADWARTARAVAHVRTSRGAFAIDLHAADAPLTVYNFVKLARAGFYDGLPIHRVVPSFVVQGGDPRGDGTGGSGKKLPAEFNSKQHVEGTVAMARSSDPNSADSQFYISLGRHAHLDNNYTVFGQVTKGMEFVKQIKVGDVMSKVSLK